MILGFCFFVAIGLFLLNMADSATGFSRMVFKISEIMMRAISVIDFELICICFYLIAVIIKQMIDILFIVVDEGKVVFTFFGVVLLL
ncbi:hypothetical protein [Bartonella phoceensis]|uniref:hypothetical protein n=1 Tax=Bartonella phoceensis TaxID=270249 RepID=UPI001ABB5F39|nr:hypothetical protein [Bartonella phoceensis]